MKNESFEVQLKFASIDPITIEIVRNALLYLQVDLTSVAEEHTQSDLTVGIFLSKIAEADKLVKQLRTYHIHGLRISIKPHFKHIWSTAWKEGWKPFELTGKFYVVPLWQESRKIPKGKEPIFLDTTNAFGTGLHETTRFTAQLIEDLHGQFCSFCDIGTGSGILLILARKLGAKPTLGFDIDPLAVKVARANLRANHLSDRGVKVADVGAVISEDKFDCVAANLVTQDLLSFQSQIIPWVIPGGHLIVSGISLSNLSRFEKGFKPKGFKKVKVVKGKDWAAVLLQRGQAT